MRKIVTYLLLFVFVWQIVGFVGYFEISHAKIKKEIKTLLKNGVPKEELIIYTFDALEMSQLVWRKKNEFDLDGNLFDVVRRKNLENGKTTLECISDKQEKVLFCELGQSISKNLGDDDHQTPVSNWFKLIKLPCLSALEDISVIAFKYEVQIQFDNAYANFFQSISNSIDSPPPQYS